MKVHAQPCARGPGAWTHQYERLRQLFDASEPRLHQWTEDPREADIVFLTNAEQPDGPALARHPLPRRHPEKCFLLSEQWQPPFLLAGVYANAPRTPFWRGRFRSGSYALHHPDFKNPFIEAHDPASAPARSPDLLASFLGRNCHPVRARLFAAGLPSADFLIEDTSGFDAFTHETASRRDAQRRYFEICLRSKFILCPRGAGPNSIRLFEALKLGIAPVIVADAWLPCEGPAWGDFALFVAERDVHRLPRILARAEPEHAERGRRAHEAHLRHFAPPSYFNFLVASAASARAARVIPERCFVALWPLRRLAPRLRRLLHHR